MGRLPWISPARRDTAGEIMCARYEHLCARLRGLELGAVTVISPRRPPSRAA
ncbi:hypothetical protein [Streptomyces celluloflavus]|uniref:hypothetical protein n=1 Tax=Streptomyces celluloflavus TaxID=58344 RepID=UPI003657472F